MIGRILLERYEITRLLGEGGMGRVFLARQLDLDRLVAIKVMHEHILSDLKLKERFQREMRLMARFQHPYAVTLYDAISDSPYGPLIVMEYIKGVSLDTLLARHGKFLPHRVARLVAQLCEVLQAAHDEKIVHRDLKPSNLMIVDADTPREKLKVMDFGLAKILDYHNQLTKITDTNIDFAVGTPAYICPESVRGEEADHRGDLYSVGVILYELLTGRVPFARSSSMDMLLAHATEPPPRFEELNLDTHIPPEIEDLVMQCLEKDPQDRPDSAAELADRYQAALGGYVNGSSSQAQLYMQLPPPSSTPSNPVMPAVPAHPLGMYEEAECLIYPMEAWMPQGIAIVKVRGFVHDAGGEVVESVPGMIRIRLPMPGISRGGPLSWLGLGRRTTHMDVELHFQQADPSRENHLHISVVFRAPDSRMFHNRSWREHCAQAFIDVRAYLMGRNQE